MSTHILSLAPDEAVRLLRAELMAARGRPELFSTAWKEYRVEEQAAHGRHGVEDAARCEAVTERAVLGIEPRVERNYWILKVILEREAGPVDTASEETLARTEMTLDEFEAALNAGGHSRIAVRLDVETSQARQHFSDWLAEMRARHPDGAADPQQPAAGVRAGQPQQPAQAGPEPADPDRASGSREVVGVLPSADALQAVVDELELSGFNRAAISVLATDRRARERIESVYRSVADIEDDPRVAQAGFVSNDSRVEGAAATVGLPMYIGGIAGAFAIVASGGALAPAIGAALAGGAAGAGLGAILASVTRRDHQADIRTQLAKGGLVLWVGTPDAGAEQRALAILGQAGAQHVHVHDIRRDWGLKDRPFALARLDPWLERDRGADR